MERLKIVCWLLVMTLGITEVQAQDQASLPSNSVEYLESGRKRIEIPRTELSPVLDGKLDDEIWKNATVISDMHQYQPQDHINPSERSVFYITYNDKYFYIAAKLYDSEPDLIGARQLVQGGGFQTDDTFSFILDTFNTGRTGYKFQVNPNGIRRDGVYQNPNSFDSDWSGIWEVEASIDDEGWTAEVAIPFATLNFDPSTEEWGFAIQREIARKRESIAWSSFNRNVNPSTTGIITGINNLQQGLGLDVVPSISTFMEEDYITGIDDAGVEPSLDVFYKFTPNLKGALTFNTDFSATEVDDQQINLSRFSLFFPEKRDFFVEDAGIFNFGGLGQNGIPFYSRRIGLSSSGQPVDIIAGSKLTGRVGRWNVGGLIVKQDEADLVNEQTVAVARVTANVLSESNVGVIFTDGDPTSNSDNSLAGMDFRYQNTRFTESHSLSGNAWIEQSDTPGLTGDDKAYGIDIDLDTQNNGFGLFAEYQRFGEDFNPALGFANRTNIENIGMNVNGRYFLKDHSLIRNIFSFMFFGQTRNLTTGVKESEDLFWRVININTHIGDQLGFGAGKHFDKLYFPFEIRPGIIIPAGDYDFNDAGVEVRFSNNRLISGRINVGGGEYYDGDRQQVNGFIRWRPDAHLNLSMNFSYQSISLSAGDFVTRQVRFNANYAFDAKWSWLNLVQYDNGSKSIGINSRLRWNPRAGEDLFLVVNYKLDSSEGAFSNLSSQSSSIVLKYTKTFRF